MFNHKSGIILAIEINRVNFKIQDSIQSNRLNFKVNPNNTSLNPHTKYAISREIKLPAPEECKNMWFKCSFMYHVSLFRFVSE
ncbi:hypothetical protein BAMA_10455 [Bacillus manliponensis]|uniref:Uncharacterized protein n=1 Tax=Bacillus manliponensis TaxID=574376 RepID=A0A073K6M0_9BACI|nr:hypothetical protein BAMA_10455 [Bacillus manliponensis]